MRSTILAGGLLLMLSGSVLAGQIYKWVDPQGVTHFGAQPPQGQTVQAISTATPAPKPSKPASGDSTAAQTKGESLQRKIDHQVKKQVAEQEAERKRYCTTLRTNLAQLQNNPRVRVEKNGDLRRLNEEERQTRIGETERKIAETCD